MSNKGRIRIFAAVVTAALGLTVMMTSAATAQWLEAGVAIKENKKVEISNHTHIVIDVPSKNLEILCTTVGGSTYALTAGSLTTAQGTYKYSGCHVFSNGVLQKNCTVDDFTVGNKATLIQHSGKTYILFGPVVEGGVLATVLFLGELCPLPEQNSIRGTRVAECVTTATLEEYDCLEPKVTHGLREALNASTLFPSDLFLYGTSAAIKVLGVFTMKLLSGNTWAGHL